ncbi:hypothetical protein [Erythrobacter sp. MTPC3]|uniref:hypothetical protein n=1 Tax=Erythrobacter sp. MTPC3 TaxID=3056564 RepID=UPI0036F422CC
MNILGSRKSGSGRDRTDTSTGEGPLRFRLYYRLMDAALIYQVFAHSLITIIGFSPTDLHPVLSGVIRAILILFQLVIVPLLIIVPTWRDEYADLLWKRTMVQLAFLMTIIPPFLLLSINFISTVFIQGDLDNWGGNRPDWLLDPLLKEAWVLQTTLYVWLVFTSAFVLLFQFNRWRDSRETTE